MARQIEVELVSPSPVFSVPRRSGYLMLELLSQSGWAVSVGYHERGVQISAEKAGVVVEIAGPGVAELAPLLVEGVLARR